ncbi:efflux RND transporter periplasmic adaptor subunit [Geobacter sp.]|uniref:efflux RND transporter periplasmic adaptor subunit n=1 Tax=Geobacter sp. TaxID=46610 RepID=UPI002638937A|nr:efflux RND transporter periplasmic adaptor subunit [Geobacter sp.]
MAHPVMVGVRPGIVVIMRGALCVFACLSALSSVACRKEKPPPERAPEVEVVPVVSRDIPIVHEWVGTADGLVNATIRAQVTGYLIRQDYREGDVVRKGQVLFEIDPRPFKAALDQAKGELARQEAQHANAKANLDRIKPLVAQNAVSKKDLDDAIGAEQSTLAAVIAARAAVENARLNLGFTRITSLINGVAGLARAQVGDLVGPAAQGGELTTVSTINPIKVRYTVNEQAYIDFMRRFSSEAAGLEEARKLEIELFLADGSRYPFTGTFYAIDRQVDVRTGTLRVEALFPNPRHLLRPGQFVRVHVHIGTKKGALLVPQRAVTELQGSYQVAVVGHDNRVEIRTVKGGERVGSLWVIEEGVRPGERVVVEGVQKVRQGLAVTPKPFAPVSTPVREPPARSESRPRAAGR